MELFFSVFKAIFVLFCALPEKTTAASTDFPSLGALLTHAAVEERRWSLTLALKALYPLLSALVLLPFCFFQLWLLDIPTGEEAAAEREWEVKYIDTVPLSLCHGALFASRRGVSCC